MTDSTTRTLRRNFFLNVTEGSFFGFAVGAASSGTVIPLFVSHMTDSAVLIALIPALQQLGWQLPQLLTAQRVARLRRYLPDVMKTSLNQRLPYFGLALIAFALPYISKELALVLTYAMLIWQGMGGGITATAWTSMIAKIIPPSRIGVFFGTQAAAGSLGGAISAVIAGVMLDRLSPNVNFGSVFVLASIAMMASWFTLGRTHEEISEPSSEDVPAFGELLRQLPALLRADMNFVWYMAARWVVQIGLMGYAFFTVYAVAKHHVTALEVGIYTSVMLVAQMLASPILGFLGDKYGHRSVMGIGLFAMLGAVLTAWLAPSGAWFGLVYFLAGVGQQAYWSPNLAIVLEFAPPAKRQIYIGLANTLVAPASLLAPIIGGVIAERAGYEAAFFVSLLGAAATIFLLLVVVRDPVRRGVMVEQPVQVTA